jgi:Cft2 family RNA processing exonuclease
MSFSAHADAKGIMQLIQYCEPKNVMLVHGENEKMDFLKSKIEEVIFSPGTIGWDDGQFSLSAYSVTRFNPISSPTVQFTFGWN